VQLFLSSYGQILFYIVLLVLVLQPLAIFLIRRRHTPPVKTRFRNASTVGATVILIPVTLWFGYTGTGLLPDWTYYLGFFLALLGNALYFWGYRTLGRNFSLEVVIYQGHQLVERGPYRLIRHPMYTALVLSSVGMGLMAQSWAAVFVIVVADSVAVWYRIRIEEKALIAEFGEQYRSYSKRVKRLIPFVF
jgi:protein-S-isoprenylcysteine O-methyltransferase Ste14